MVSLSLTVPSVVSCQQYPSAFCLTHPAPPPPPPDCCCCMRACRPFFSFLQQPHTVCQSRAVAPELASWNALSWEERREEWCKLISDWIWYIFSLSRFSVAKVIYLCMIFIYSVSNVFNLIPQNLYIIRFRTYGKFIDLYFLKTFHLPSFSDALFTRRYDMILWNIMWPLWSCSAFCRCLV